MMSEATLDAVMAVMDASFDPHWREAWTRAQITDSLQMPSTFLMLGDDEGRVITQGAAASFVCGYRPTHARLRSKDSHLLVDDAPWAVGDHKLCP